MDLADPCTDFTEQQQPESLRKLVTNWHDRRLLKTSFCILKKLVRDFMSFAVSQVFHPPHRVLCSLVF
jgi:hypothetical protein